MRSFHQKPSSASQVTLSFDMVLEQKNKLRHNTDLIEKFENRKKTPVKSFSSVVKRKEDDTLMDGIILPNVGEKCFMNIASAELPNDEETASGTPDSFGETTNESDSEDNNSDSGLSFPGSSDALVKRSISNDSTEKNYFAFKSRFLEPTCAVASNFSVAVLKAKYQQEAVGVSGCIGYWRHKSALFGGTYDQAIAKLKARSGKNVGGASDRTLKAFSLE